MEIEYNCKILVTDLEGKHTPRMVPLKYGETLVIGDGGNNTFRINLETGLGRGLVPVASPTRSDYDFCRVRLDGTGINLAGTNYRQI